jgi:hypothetical protein
MNRRTVILVAMLIALAGCCPWADWQPCRADVTVEDTNGQPVDAMVFIIKRATLQEFSHTNCPGACTVEVPDLFHNGDWASSDGLILRAVASGKQALEMGGTCQHYGMNVEGQVEPGRIVMQLTDSP